MVDDKNSITNCDNSMGNAGYSITNIGYSMPTANNVLINRGSLVGYGLPSAAKICDTSMGINVRRLFCKMGDSRSLSCMTLRSFSQADLGFRNGKYACASSIRPYALMWLFIVVWF